MKKVWHSANKDLSFIVIYDMIFSLQTDVLSDKRHFRRRLPHIPTEYGAFACFFYFAYILFAFFFTDAAVCSIMKGECNLSTTKKSLNDLTLLDRFLFAEAVEDPEIMQLILEIILGQEIRLDGLPQTEKETRNSPLYRHIRLDVWARDLDSRIYDTEVQSRNTGNLPRRSRYYQGQIDTKLLKPGTVDFNLLSDIVLILIAPFDLIGEGRYRYTFQMCCMENRETILADGAVRIFLNTHGKNPQDISPELAQLLHFMEHTNDPPLPQGECEKVRRLRRKIEAIKSNEEVGVRFMQAWEERELEKMDARAEGERANMKKLVRKKLAACQSLEKIAEDLMEEPETIRQIAESLSLERV